VFVDNDIPESRRKLGWYEVNGKVYLNKYHALEQCAPNEWPKWNFHDDAYSRESWGTEPAEDLYEIYRQRADQLRKKYQYVILYYSGGIDSHAILNTFIEHKIPLDGIIVSGSYSLNDELAQGCNQEQLRVAKPYLDDLIAKGVLTCPVHYLDTVAHHQKFTDENWVYACGQALTPQVYSYNFFWEDPWVQNFLLKGSTCFIRGVDKPRVLLEDGKWYVGFIDGYIMSGTPTGHLSKNQDWDIQEYFYWTPDFTKIVNKQAHTLINWFESNLSPAECEKLTSKEAKNFNRSRYNKYVDPLVYGRYVNQEIGGERPYFTLNKPFSSNVWHKDFWFFKAKDVMPKEYQAWAAGLAMVSKKITPDHFNKQSFADADQDALSTFLKQYNLGPEFLDLNQALFGTVGCWSKFHYVKDANFVKPV
jgi:hypothetical protein